MYILKIFLKMNLQIRNRENIIAISISVFAFVIYFFTASRTVSFIDAGELATVSLTLGIAHPTGYPLFTILGNLWSKLPLGISKIFQLNLLSSLLCSLSLFFFFKFLIFIFKNNFKVKNETILIFSATISTLLLAFSETFWQQSIIIEVYSLHILFISILLFQFVKFISTKKLHDGILFAFFLGLSFANHLTTILFAPAFLFLFFKTFGFNKNSFQKILWFIIPFVIGLSVYVYLPLQAKNSPTYNWGNPIDWEKFLRHTSGKQYRGWFFSSIETMKIQLKYFFSDLLKEFSYVSIPIVFIGVFQLLKKSKSIFIFVLLLFLFCIFYSSNYDIHDIDSYFLLAYFSIAILFFFGTQFLLEKNYSNLKIAIFSVIGIVPLFANYLNVDESKNFAAEDYTKNIFSSVEKNAIIISYQWDFFVSPSYYFQEIENLRKDVIVIDKELLRRSWYFNYLKKKYPEVVKKSQKEIDDFLESLKPFENDLPFDGNYIEQFYQKLITSFIEKNIDEKPIYISPEIEKEYVKNYILIPSGLVFRVFKSPNEITFTPKFFEFRPIENKGRLTNSILQFYSKSYKNQAKFSSQIGDTINTKKFLEKLNEIETIE